MEHSWREKSYCPSPGKRAFQVCKVGRALAFLHGVLHFMAVVVYILPWKVNDIPEFLQVLLQVMHFCQIRRVNLARLGLAAELGRMICRSDADGPGCARPALRPEHGEAANTFPALLSYALAVLHGLLFADAWLRVVGLAGLV